LLEFQEGGIHRATTDDLVFREHRIQLHRVGDRRRSIYLAGTPPPSTGRSVAAVAYPAQFPLHWIGSPGPPVVSPDLPPAFAHSAAYADIIAAILALLSLLLLRSAAGVAVVWIFNLWGTADLLNSFYQGPHAGLLAGQLGAAYFIPTLIVPLLLITHGLAFRILLLPQKDFAMQESRHVA
jgi:hypothetical protein